MTTVAPSSANILEIASPMPMDAPVTTTTFPDKSTLLDAIFGIDSGKQSLGNM
jgi:hypothetical protein